MAWTKDQEKAINTTGGKVVVSAAAGSGKTAVLSERVLSYVLNGGNIDDLLVVTFTNAAALEMKTRIKKKISEAATNNKDFEKQLVLIDNAKITTMDAFYADLVKQNFEILEIMPDFQILASAEEKLIQNKVLDKVVETTIGDELYKDMYDMFCDSDVASVKELILNISKFLSTIPFYQTFLEESLDKYSNDTYKKLLFDLIKEKLLSYKKIYISVKEELNSASSDYDVLDYYIMPEICLMDTILKMDSFNELSRMLKTFDFDRLKPMKNHANDSEYVKYKNIRDTYKNFVNKTLKPFYNITDESFEEEKILMKNILKQLFDVVIIFKNNLLEEKKKINKYSFSDIPLFVIDLLIKDNKKTFLAEKLSNKYNEILIDEYQDTNRLQNVIFEAISKNNSNLFIVGDIKQSIYKFRSACPDIFNNDKKNASKDRFPMLINLSKNFRSRNLVLDFCNFIFENTMTDYLGEVEYDDAEKLYLGADYEDNDNMVSEINIIYDDKEETDEDDLSKIEKEAIFVANKVKSLLDSKQKIYDNKKREFRCISPSDIVLLFRSLSNSDYYRLALLNRGINVYSDAKVLYFNNYDVKLIISLLKVIDNYYDDISLMSVLKSDLFNITDEKIANVRIKNKYEYLYDSIINSGDADLLGVLNILKSLKEYFNNNTISNSLNYMYNKLNIIDLIGTTKAKIKNLTLMINYSKLFEEGSFKTLHEFVLYINEVILDKNSFEGVNPISEGDNVLITTIHQSKGLEYPIVFVCETGRKFNFKDLQNDFMYDDNLGFTFNIRNKKLFAKYPSVPMMLFKEKKKLMQLSEELRILYVALTRAKEKIIITGFVSNLDVVVNKATSKIGEDKSISSIYLEDSNNYILWLIGCILRYKNNPLRDFSQVDNKTFISDAKMDINIINSNSIKDELLEENIVTTSDKEEAISNYDDSLINVPERLSVSDIKSENHKFYRKPYFINGDNKATSIGTLYHKIFEILPVEKYTINTLTAAINKLNISKEEKESINLEKVFAYLTSDLYENILSADNVYKEKQLVFNVPAKYYDVNLKNGNILIDGTIDLLFNNGNHYTIVDYKTDKVEKIEELVLMYKSQLDLYEQAVIEKFNAKSVDKYVYSITLNKYIKL